VSDEMDVKSFGPLNVENAELGEVTAIVATLNVVDKDGDVILPGAIPTGGAKVKMSGYAHDVILGGAAPVGKGTITEENGKAVFRGKFFMTTERGREAFHTVKELGTDSEWSFGFPRQVKTAEMSDDWKGKGAKRLIAGLRPIEASPVIVGAGVDTGTVGVKSEQKPEEKPVEPARPDEGDLDLYRRNQDAWLKL
jgi:hypothetical protein